MGKLNTTAGGIKQASVVPRSRRSEVFGCYRDVIQRVGTRLTTGNVKCRPDSRQVTVHYESTILCVISVADNVHGSRTVKVRINT